MNLTCWMIINTDFWKNWNKPKLSLIFTCPQLAFRHQGSSCEDQDNFQSYIQYLSQIFKPKCSQTLPLAWLKSNELPRWSSAFEPHVVFHLPSSTFPDLPYCQSAIPLGVVSLCPHGKKKTISIMADVCCDSSTLQTQHGTLPVPHNVPKQAQGANGEVAMKTTI